jgi:hypothetical protein
MKIRGRTLRKSDLCFLKHIPLKHSSLMVYKPLKSLDNYTLGDINHLLGDKMPRNLNLRVAGRESELFKLPSIVNEIAPLLVLSTLAIEDKGLGLTAARIHEEIRALFLKEGGITMPPSFLYPLMKGMVKAKLLEKDGLRYRLSEKHRGAVLRELDRLSGVAVLIQNFVMEARERVLTSAPKQGSRKA